MTAKDKAKKLIEKFAAYSYHSGGSLEVMAGNQLYSAKQCALICCNEIINNSKFKTIYWQQVKEEIEKL